MVISEPSFVPGINDKSSQVCVPSNPVLSVTSISLRLLSGPISSIGEMWSRPEKMRPWWLKSGLFSLATNPVLSPEFIMGHCDKSLDRRTIGTCHDQRAVGIEVGSEHDFRTACLPPGRCFRDLRDSTGCDPNSITRWTPLVHVA